MESINSNITYNLEQINDKANMRIGLNKRANKENYSPASPSSSKRNCFCFPWYEKWLKGNEYYQMLTDYRFYSETFNFKIYDKMPEFIYLEPKNGTIFYLREYKFEDINFPRLQEFKKKFKWKKMNFVTNLPKKNPKVSYLVASTTFTDQQDICFRMHFVVPYDNCIDIMLCHILQIYPLPSHQEMSSGMATNCPDQEKMQTPCVCGLNQNIAKKLKEETTIPQPQVLKVDYLSSIKIMEQEIKQRECNRLFLSNTNESYNLPKKGIKNISGKSFSKNSKMKSFIFLPETEELCLKFQEEGNGNNQRETGDYYDPNKNAMRAFMASKLLPY